METVLKAIADWIKGILTAGIMSNLSGLFDAVNEQVGDIAQQVGTRPSAFEPRVFAMIESLSRNVVLPIAGIILTFIACYELIEMITQHNNMAQFEPALIMRWIFKTAVSVWFIRQLSELVSFVTQDNFLFNCSLKENIRLGNPNATDEEVYAAAKAACCDEFIVRLDKGYDTPAGDAGKRLSGGEKQRIAIARAILKNAPIVILDEATAFTDPQNEDKIQKSIMALSKGKTLLVIAHRLSTIQNADQIVVLKKGRIVDCGKQEELLKRCPLYADMWKAHIGAKNWSVSEKKEVAAHV